MRAHRHDGVRDLKPSPRDSQHRGLARPDFSVTDTVSDEVKSRQARPLEAIYFIVYLECIHLKVREGAVRVKAVYLAIGNTMQGNKAVLGLWLAQTEGRKVWLQVAMELRNRGAQDIFIACVDGLNGFPVAI